MDDSGSLGSDIPFVCVAVWMENWGERHNRICSLIMERHLMPNYYIREKEEQNDAKRTEKKSSPEKAETNQGLLEESNSISSPTWRRGILNHTGI